jgi:putative ABC transport system permease protein
MTALLATLSWPEWRAHPWRQGVALIALALGVALGLSVHLINASALAEFGSAVRALNGSPDFELRSVDAGAFGGAGFDEALYARVATHPQVSAASPVIEARAATAVANGVPVEVRVLGVDAFVVAAIAPGLMPQPDAGAERLSLVAPERVFLNPAARQLVRPGAGLALQSATGPVVLHPAGGVTAGGPPLVVMDIAGAQAVFGQPGRLTRIDVLLRPGADRTQVIADLQLPPKVRVAQPEEAQDRMANFSRAYRVNLTVLSLVALFTGAFLVFSVQALAVARRVPQFALLGVLGLSARERRRLVLAEGALLGLAGSALGLLLGAGLAAAALRVLGADLGGGYFQGLAPRLHWQWGAALLYAALGVAAALLGAWVPARQAEQLAPAQALKGLGLEAGRHLPGWAGPLLLALAVGLSLLPPIAELPVAAYLGVALGLLGGILCVPAGVGLLARVLPAPRGALALLAVERAREQRSQASVAVAGVVASLSLGVALTVMVGSFRTALDDWLQQLLPADLYVRSGATSDIALLPPTLASQAAALPGVAQVQVQRVGAVSLDPQRPAVALLARPLPADPAQALPLVGPLLPGTPGAVPVFVSEAFASLYAAPAGTTVSLPLGPQGRQPVQVRGVWRDYARQHGAVLMALDDYRRLTGDTGITDLALWLSPGAGIAPVQAGLRQAAGGVALEMATTAELRGMSMRLFDRSFAVTTYLQVVAIGIGLVGIAASFSAQVLARRKEFGMLAHLGVTRREVLALVAAEGAVWTGAGALLGLMLGLGVSVVLVHVVNPQSFHWTMEMTLPAGRLAALCTAVLAAGTLTAAVAGRAAARRDIALAVKEDW